MAANTTNISIRMDSALKTQADKLFTVDKRFASKCKAIYHFLGVDTEVILCPQKEISKILQTHI